MCIFLSRASGWEVNKKENNLKTDGYGNEFGWGWHRKEDFFVLVHLSYIDRFLSSCLRLGKMVPLDSLPHRTRNTKSVYEKDESFLLAAGDVEDD